MIDIQSFIRCENSLHHAAQFVSAIANGLIGMREDDSQSALLFSTEEELLHTEQLPTEHVDKAALNVREFSIELYCENKLMYSLNLHHISKARALERLNAMLAASGCQQEIALPNHYNIPALQQTAYNDLMVKPDAAALQHWLKVRTAVVLALRTAFATKNNALTWPHHFDTAVLMQPEEEQYINAGIAIADQMVHQPYLYLNFSGFNSDELKNIAEINASEWLSDESWKGFVLPYEQFGHPAGMEKTINEFFQHKSKALKLL